MIKPVLMNKMTNHPKMKRIIVVDAVKPARNNSMLLAGNPFLKRGKWVYLAKASCKALGICSRTEININQLTGNLDFEYMQKHV